MFIYLFFLNTFFCTKSQFLKSKWDLLSPFFLNENKVTFCMSDRTNDYYNLKLTCQTKSRLLISTMAFKEIDVSKWHKDLLLGTWVV